ncbi:toll-like receptor 7 [Liolophura sinensis]|uniref:toll-like receptor 7 n=1 Tax=Liolophura sinensis TaxID=3198878 RepID=UPI0031598C26
MELKHLGGNEFVTSWIAFFMLTAFWITSGRSESLCFSLTRYNVSYKRPHSSYSGKSLKQEVVYIRVAQDNLSVACSFDLCDIIYPSKQPGTGAEHVNAKQSYKLTSIRVECPVAKLVKFEALNCSVGLMPLYEVSLNHCKIRTTDVHRLLGRLNASTVILNETEVEPPRSRGIHRVISRHLETFAVENINLKDRFNELFPSAGKYENVLMCRLSNVSLEQLPENFLQRFPHLQYLNLSRNSFTSPPNFPWDTESHTHMPLQLMKIRKSFLVGLPDDASPIVLVLDHNNITSLINFTFRGSLNVLSLVKNGLELIGTQTFINLTDLTYLNISDNNLRSIPQFCLGSECKLQTLDLRKNLLQHINVEIFRTLKELRILNIANNKLKRIEEDSFSSLRKLRTLHLENNEITFIHQDSLPTDSDYLHEIYLQNNPLIYLPEGVIFLTGITLVDLSGCNITFNSLLDTINAVNIHSFTFILNDAAATRTDDYDKTRENLLKRRQDYKRTINLSGNNISSIPAPILSNVSDRDEMEMERKFRLLLIYFKFDLSENPLWCDCKMVDFLNYISVHTTPSQDTFLGDEYFFTEWKCSGPAEFFKQSLLSQKSSNLYCQAVNVTCPARCRCYRYAQSTHRLVDCGNSQKVTLPQDIPKETLTLRLNDNNITVLTPRDYLSHIETLNLSNNNLEELPPEVLRAMPKLRHLYLDHNALQTLPRLITKLDRIREITLSNNRFHCDCHSVWLKSWLLINEHRVKDVSDVLCIKSDRTISVMIRVNDADFVCVRGKNMTYFQVCMSITSCFVMAVIIGFVCYCLRLELRALVYSYFMVRLFDRSTNPEKDEVIKILVAVAQEDYEFCQQQLLPIFQSDDRSNLVVVTCRDFIAGLSRVQNLSHMVKCSFRMVAVVTEKFLSEEVCRLALDKGLTKARAKKHFLVIFTADVANKTNLRSINTRLGRFYKTRRYQCIGQSDVLRDKKLKYLTSAREWSSNIEESSPWWDICLQSLSVSESSQSCLYDVYIAYDASDFQWSFYDLRCKLEADGFSTRLSDLHFIPGDPIQDNMVHGVSSCRYVLLVLSTAFVANEWPLFLLRIAYERTLRENNNSLIVITTEDLIPSSIEDEDLSLFLKTHAYLERGDSDWWMKLRRSLTKTSRSSSALDMSRQDQNSSANALTQCQENVVVEETNQLFSTKLNKLSDSVCMQELDQIKENVSVDGCLT